jgi:hypothetical protein
MYAVHKNSASHCFHRTIINAHSTILIGHVPGFPPGPSCRLPLWLYFIINQLFFSSFPPRNWSSLYSTTLLLSPDLFIMSITDQITEIILLDLCISTVSLPFSFPRKCHYSKKFSCCQGTAKSWRFPLCYFLSRRYYSSVFPIAFHASLRVSLP